MTNHTYPSNPRWAVTMYLAGTWGYSILDPITLELGEAEWPIFLTNWGYSFCLVQSLICCVCLTAWIRRNVNKDNKSQRSSWPCHVYKIYWACNTIARDLAFAITVLYWTILYTSQDRIDAKNIFGHATNSVAMFIELCVLTHPIYFLHFYWPAVFVVTYAVFSAIYFAAGGTNSTGEPYIYKAFDWRNAGRTIEIFFGGLVFVILVHCVSTCVSLLRALIHKKIFERTQTLSNKGNDQEGSGNLVV